MSYFALMQEGEKEAERLGLTKRENWTPLLTYIHATRLIIGTILGFIMGICVAGIFALLICC